MFWDKVLRRFRNSLQKKHDTLTADDPTGWNSTQALFGGQTMQALKLPAVNACIEIISDSIAKMPVYLMNSETKERDTEHPVLQLLTCRPTEMLTAFDYHKLMEVRRMVYGNAYALIWRDRWGAPVELLPIAPGYMCPYLDDDGKLWYVGINPRTKEYRKFWPSDILHYKTLSTDGLEGVGYLRRGREVIEAAMQAQKYETGFYANGARPDGVLSTDTDLSMAPKFDKEGNPVGLKDKIRAEWERIHAGPDNAYRIAVLDNGLKYTPISATNRDAQFVESKTVQIEDIGRLFNIPLYKLGVGKQTYASNVQAALEYIQRTLSPIVAEHEQEDTYKLLTESERKRKLQIRRNMMGELRGDWAGRATWFKTMRDIGAYSVNDILGLEDLPDVPGGENRLASLNYVPLDQFRELSLSRNATPAEQEKQEEEQKEEKQNHKPYPKGGETL